MDEHFLNRIIKPQDCALCFGIPTSREGFAARKNRADGVARQGITTQWRYLDVLNGILPAIKKLGVNVFENLTLENFREMLNGNFAVTILFSHWIERDGKFLVEMEEGFVGVEQVTAAAPEHFTGILDLSVCNAPPLAKLVKTKFDDRALVMCSDQKVVYLYWLLFYRLLFKKLEDEKLRYLDAWGNVIELIAEKHHQNER